MARQRPIEIITPPNALKAKIGGPLPALDQRAIARAEAALAKLSDQFADWIQEELARLVEAWAAYEKLGPSEANKAELHRRAHDLKGLAPTYGYPLVGRVCNSLCKLTSDEAIGINPPLPLLKAHVDAVRAIVGGKIMNADHPVGVALAAELEGRMLELVNSMTPPPVPPKG
jgi:HPt (histidine-containing phosphotransfer) domain-containing protein